MTKYMIHVRRNFAEICALGTRGPHWVIFLASRKSKKKCILLIFKKRLVTYFDEKFNTFR